MIAASLGIFSRLECSSLRILCATCWIGNLILLPELVDLLHWSDQCANMRVVWLWGHSLVMAGHILFPQIIVVILLITLLRVVSYLLHWRVTNSCVPPWCLNGFNVILFISSLPAATLTTSLKFAPSVTTLLWVLPPACVILLCRRLFWCNIKDEFFGRGRIIIVIGFSFLCNFCWSKLKLSLSCLFSSDKLSQRASWAFDDERFALNDLPLSVIRNSYHIFGSLLWLLSEFLLVQLMFQFECDLFIIGWGQCN